MNRREVMATGIGLGSWVLSSSSTLACCGADEKEKDPKLTGPVYCPMYPYMFCGSYTLYYAVQYENGNCGANPASLAGPNNLTCGCPGADCAATFKRELTARAAAVAGNHVCHKKIKDYGLATFPPSVLRIDGVHLTKRILDVKKQNGSHDYFARVFDVTVIKSELDKAELLSTMTQADIDKIADVFQYFPGHESNGPITGETPVSATEVSKDGHVRIVQSTATTQQYLVVMK